MSCSGRGYRLKHRTRMIALILATLFFSLRGRNPLADFSVGARRHCQDGFCVTLDETEITAEAGLCVTISCLFSVRSDFKPTSMVWFKCGPSGCTDLIFYHNKSNINVQPGFRGRVLRLKPKVLRKNCSIIINDLTVSDAGLYQFRVEGATENKPKDGFSFTPKPAVSVKELTQKPAVMIPPLTAGQQTTLTCTAPGLCSGSDPHFTWTWRGRGENDSHITGNITALRAENVAAILRRHSSTLTFNSSAEHHNTNVTCKVTFTNDVTTEERVTLAVTYVKEIEVTGNTTVKEGETLNLGCSVESFPSSLITWTKVAAKSMQNGSDTILQDNNFRDLQSNISTALQNNTETRQQEGSPMVTFSISNVAAEDAGQYICTVKHLNNTLMKKVNLTVTYLRELAITGDTTIELGDALNLTCSVESIPPSRVAWSSPRSNTSLHNESHPGLQSNTGSATLLIHSVTTEDSGRYNCLAQNLDRTVTKFADVFVTIFPKILKGSGCRAQSEVLTCVCISVGPPLPTITWPMLKNLTEYSVVTTVSKHTVNSTAILNVTQLRNNVVECLSSNENGDTKEDLDVSTDTSAQEDKPGDESTAFHWLEIIIALSVGALLSALISCLITIFCRIKQRSFGNLDETLEMVTNHEVPRIDVGQAVENDRTYHQGERRRAATAAKAALDRDVEPEDVEYASIDFSMLKRQSEVDKKREADTEYTEIKLAKEEREEYGGVEGEALEGKEKEAMMGEDEETKCCAVEEAH